MNKNKMKYSQGINFLELVLAEETDIKTLCRATPDLVISQSSSSRI
jgi:hypothetical protein